MSDQTPGGIPVMFLTPAILAALLASGVSSAHPAVVAPSTPRPPGWVSPRQCAEHTGFTTKTIRTWCAFAPSEVAWKVGRDWRIDQSAFETWLKAGGPQAAIAAIGRSQGGMVQ